ncbi:MAG: UDP-N-acetylmuramoyl-L-alanine--D-glutamate ligase [Coleofasciculaceae cyanobacterium]
MPNAQIIGLGRSGIAAARLLKQSGWQVMVSDRNISEVLQKQQQTLAAEGITVKLGDYPTLDSPDLPELIVVSPGVPWDIPILQEARSKGIDTIGELELAWRYLNSSPWVGITGTNGKTTTTALIAAIFQTAGFQAPACGNIGHAACELALGRKEEKRDWVIAEISSYQIESSQELAPQIGVWTTFTPDHLERHKSLENYYTIKASLLQRSKLQVFNGDDPYLRQLGKKHWPDAYWTSVRGAGGEADFQPWVYLENGWVIVNSQKILPVASLRMVGEHNYQNLLMAVAVAQLAEIEPEAIAQAIADFPGVPHRLEQVISWQSINFINDSKATNYDAAQVGLAAVDSPAILIAGGQGKAGDDTTWLKTIQAKAAAVLLIGEAAPSFAQRLEQVGYGSYEIVEILEKAVPRALQLAQKYHAQVVLLSPACASFDQYQSFEHRGEHFRQLCLELMH